MWHEIHSVWKILFLFYLILFKDFIYLFFRERERERERGKETSMLGCLLSVPYWGPGPQTRHVSWTGNQTSAPWVHRPALNPLSHTSQGKHLNFWHEEERVCKGLENTEFGLGYLKFDIQEEVLSRSLYIKISVTISTFQREKWGAERSSTNPRSRSLV